MSPHGILRVLDKLECYVGQLLLVFFICLIFTQTVLRSVFSIVIPWSEEASRFAFVWFVFFGAAYAARLSAHNRVVIQFKLLPEWVGKYSMLITDILWLLFNGMMVKMSFVIIDDLREFPYMSPAMNLSMEYVYWIFPIAFTLMSLRILQVDYIRYILKQEIKDVDKIEAEDYEAIVEGGTLGSAGQANEKEEARV
ncbi:TRAP transporter small permease [Bilophila wadsworthia]|uniref:TRAP transporter small permease n=1 Tax=Bilophila wadsworthia TaxID=35833 RepID=UPI002430204C|nr:TRAP transporter small permease [Bilophila wadsworthia]